MFKNSITTEIKIKSNIEDVWKEFINFEEYKNWNPAIYEVSGNIKENERMLSIYLERLDFVIEQERKDQREKQRVAGAVSVIGGMMLVILFI